MLIKSDDFLLLLSNRIQRSVEKRKKLQYNSRKIKETGQKMGENIKKDTIYLTSEQLGDEQEILFQGEIPGIFVEEAVRRHTRFPW